MTTSENTDRTPDEAPVDPSTVEEQLRRIVASAEFSASPRLQEFLTYIVEATLDGHSDRVKGITIAQDVFGQSDPEVAQSSTIVSVQAGRLRRTLTDYYRGNGIADPVVIEVPKGTFVPVFTWRSRAQPPLKPSKAASDDERPGSIRRISLVLAIAALMIGGTAIWLWRSGGTAEHVDAVIFERPAIAVVPFRNSTGTPLNDHILATLTEDIVTDLSAVQGVDVISYASVSHLTGSDMTPSQIADVLAVSHILDGSVRGEEPNLQINAELLDARTGKVLWARRTEFSPVSQSATAKEMAADVLDGLSVKKTDWNIDARKAVSETNTETAALIAQAMAFANPPTDPLRLDVSQQIFEAVIERAPTIGDGYAGLGYIRMFRGFWGHADDTEAEALASIAMADKALDINPWSSLALTSKALSYLTLRDFSKSVAISEQALEVGPNDPYAHIYHAFILTADGRPDVGIPFAEQAIRLDPLSPRTPYRNILAVAQVQAGEYAAAIRTFEDSVRMGGPDTPGHAAGLAAAYAGLGNTEEARRLMSKVPDGYLEGRSLDWRIRVFRRPEDAARMKNLLQSQE